MTHIGSVPLSNRLPEDTLIWRFEKDMEYYVKTTYHLLSDIRSASKSGPSTRLRQKAWKNLWKVSINEHIKNFTWRLAKDIMSTKAKLSKKRYCFGCFLPFHLFLQCNFSKKVFFSSPLGVRLLDGCYMLD